MTEVEQTIAEKEAQQAQLRAEIDQYTAEIDEQQELRRQTDNKDVRLQADSRINALNQARGKIGNQYDQIRQELRMLRISSTPEEYSQRKSVYQRQTQAQEIRQQQIVAARTQVQQVKAKGGFEAEGVLFDTEGNIVGATTRQGYELARKTLEEREAKRLELARRRVEAMQKEEILPDPKMEFPFDARDDVTFQMGGAGSVIDSVARSLVAPFSKEVREAISPKKITESIFTLSDLETPKVTLKEFMLNPQYAIPLPEVPTKTISLWSIKSSIENLDLNKLKVEESKILQIGSVLAPETVQEAVVLAAFPSFYGKLPSLLKGVVSAGFLVGGTSAALDKEYSPEQRFQGALMAGLGAAGIGAEAYTYAWKPIRIKTSLREPITPQAREVTIPVVTDKGAKQISSYEIIGEVRPPLIEIETTRLKADLFKLRRIPSPTRFVEFVPKVSIGATITPPKTFKVRTLGFVEQGKPFNVATVIQGSRKATISTIYGSSETFPISKATTLSKTEQYALSNLVQRRGLNDIPLREAQLSRAYLQKRDLFKSTIPSGRVEVLPIEARAKSVVRSQAISETKLFIEGDKFEVFNIATQFKDVTYPFARATGKSPRLETELLSIKEPIVLTTEKQWGKVYGMGVPKTPWSKTLPQETVLQQGETLPKTIPKITTPRTKITIPESTTTITMPSIYTGQGRYELTTGTMSTSMKSNIGIIQPSLSKIENISLLEVSNIQIPSYIVKTQQKPQLKLETKQLQKLETKVVQEPKQKTSQKTMIKPTLRYVAKMTPPPITPNVYQIARTTTTKVRAMVRIPKAKPISTSFGKFPVLLRRYGKFRIVGYGRTPLQALQIGKTAAGRTLGATFKVPTIKQPVKIKGFRTKKTKEGFEFIELPKYRLSTRPEVKEIQIARRQKGGIF